MKTIENYQTLEPFHVTNPNVTHAIIEIFGGDNNLSPVVMEDLWEMAEGMEGNFATLALADFNDTRASVIEVTTQNGIQTLESWGEIDTGDPETLAVFLSRALRTYNKTPHIAIGFWDHGSGVFNEYDPNETYINRNLTSLLSRASHTRDRSVPKRSLFFSRARIAASPRVRAMLHDVTNGGVLTNHEAHGVMTAAFKRAGIKEKIDMIFSDTCLNGMIEVLHQFNDFAKVVIGSEDLEPGDGWDYYCWFNQMSQSPADTAENWAKQAVESYQTCYQNRPRTHPVTLAAFRTDSDLVTAIGELVKALDASKTQGFNWLHQARMYTQSFANKSTYDIKDLVDKLHDIAGDEAIKTACRRVSESFDNALIHSAALGSQVENANGLAIWLPEGKRNFLEVADTYRKLNFDQMVRWADYHQQYYGAIV